MPDKKLTHMSLIAKLSGTAREIAREHAFTGDTTVGQLAGSKATRFVEFGRYSAINDVIADLSTVRESVQRATIDAVAMPQNIGEYVDTHDAARYLGKSYATMQQWAARGVGPFMPYKKGRSVLWATSDIRAYLDAPMVRKEVATKAAE